MPNTASTPRPSQAGVASILLVDDRIENLVALESILEPLGQKLVRAMSGREALRQVLSEEFALIVLDVQMPGMDGFETAELLKQREKSCNIPIIFVTAISKEQRYVTHGYSIGAVDYMTKPLDPTILQSKAAVFVDLYQKEQKLRRQAELLHESELRDLQRRQIEHERQVEREHLAALARSEASLSRFKRTLDAVVEAVLMFEPESLRCSYASRGALDLLGWTEEEMRFKAVTQCIAPAEEERFRESLRTLRRGPERQRRFETRMLSRDGQPVPVEVVLQYVCEPDEPNRFVCIAHDIAERKRTEAVLAQAYEREKRIASVLQNSLLLSHDMEELPGLQVEAVYEPALDEANVGGDLYDAFRLPSRDTALVVGDVSGKGLQAAARIAEVKFSLRAILTETPDPSAAMERLNRLLIATGSESRSEAGAFVALSLAVVSSTEPTALLASAAAEPGIVVNRAGSVERIRAEGLPLGIDPAAEFESRRFTLKEGDTLLMFTDGIVEARNGAVFFGDDGVESAASAAAAHERLGDVARHVYSAARDFAGRKLTDDACLLAARRKQHNVDAAPQPQR